MTNTQIGAKTKKKVLEMLGKIISLITNFKPSATACKIPQKPTTFGPRRRWIEAKTLRSQIVKNATVNNIGNKVTKFITKRITKTPSVSSKKNPKFILINSQFLSNNISNIFNFT